jgi:tetratricopeptide (TPR) repeat protein
MRRDWPSRRAEIARTHLGNSSRADRALKRALALDQKRFDRFPENRLAQFDLAVDLSNLAYIHMRHNELADASAFYTRSLEIREGLLASDPKDSLSREKVAFIHKQLGYVNRNKGDTKLALEHFRLAIEGYSRTTSITVQGRQQVAAAWAEVGALEAASGRAVESCEAFQRAFVLHRALTEAEREAGSVNRIDPMPSIARSAARCGHRDAVQWTRAESHP